MISGGFLAVDAITIADWLTRLLVAVVVGLAVWLLVAGALRIWRRAGIERRRRARRGYLEERW